MSVLKKREMAHPTSSPFISLGSAAPNQALGRGGKTAASFVEWRDFFFLISAGVFVASNKRRSFLKSNLGCSWGGWNSVAARAHHAGGPGLNAQAPKGRKANSGFVALSPS